MTNRYYCAIIKISKKLKRGDDMYAEFDISLVTGNEEIDEQHKEWIEKINKLFYKI